MNDAEQRAVARVLRAGVKAPLPAIIDWVRAVGPVAILAASLAEIRRVANAF
jgi:hypothetical protein